MAENYKNKLLIDFSGGVNLSPGRLLTGDNEMTLCQNGYLEKIGPVTKVRGYVQHGADVNDGYEILGMCTAYKTDGTQKFIVIADNASDSDAYTFNTSTQVWTPHGLSLSVGSKAEFEHFLDGFFMVNYTEATRWNDFTAWSTTTNVTNAPKAKYIKQYLSRIYLGYVVDGATTYPSRVIYSDLPTGSPMTIAWNNAENYFDVSNDDGDVIKGFAENANRLMVFKENSLFRYDTNTLYQVPGCPGTNAQRSVQNIQGWTLYYHMSGLWGYNGTSSQLLSRKIQDIIDGVSIQNLSKVCAFAKGDHYYLYLGDVENTSRGIDIPKCLLDYDIAKNGFVWRSLGVVPTVFSEYKDDRTTTTYDSASVTYNSPLITYNSVTSSEPKIYFGDNDGAVYQFDVGQTFAGSSIPMLIETRDIYLNDPTSWKILQKVHVLSDGGMGMTIQYKLDDNDWKTLGKVQTPQQELLFHNSARGKRIRFRVLEMSTGGQFDFEGLDIYFTVEGTTL